jgi:hypothetical protein
MFDDRIPFGLQSFTVEQLQAQSTGREAGGIPAECQSQILPSSLLLATPELFGRSRDQATSYGLSDVIIPPGQPCTHSLPTLRTAAINSGYIEEVANFLHGQDVSRLSGPLPFQPDTYQFGSGVDNWSTGAGGVGGKLSDEQPKRG